jgi:hypothetical protein
MLRLAAGGGRAEAEASRTVTEKILTAGEAASGSGRSRHARPQGTRRRWKGSQRLQDPRSRQQTQALPLGGLRGRK